MTLRRLFFDIGTTSRTTDLGLLVLRLGVGLTMAFAHGLGKLPPSEGFVGATEALGFPAPAVFAWAAGLAEFVGGLCLALGLATRPAALAVAFTMAVARFGQHGSDPFADGELAWVYLFAALGLAVTGPGRFALDRLFEERRTAAYV